jgi:hypothetical protein
MRPDQLSPQVIEVFRTGFHQDSAGQYHSVSPVEVLAIAGLYNSQRKRAPLRIGHPDDDDTDMSLGHVRSLHTSQDGTRMFAQIEAAPLLVSEVARGALRAVSCAFWAPGRGPNSAGIVALLKHVGFLGAQLPGVLGMAPPAFCDDVQSGLVFAAAPGKAPACTDRQRLHVIALRHQKACPELSYIDCIRRAELAARLH